MTAGAQQCEKRKIWYFQAWNDTEVWHQEPWTTNPTPQAEKQNWSVVNPGFGRFLNVHPGAAEHRLS